VVEADLERLGYTKKVHPVIVNDKLPGAVILIASILLCGVICLFSSCGMTPARAEEIRLSEHFTQSEFSCKCCGKVKVNIQLIISLEKLREKVGVPIIITSGYRCPLHNKAVGGAKHSQHQFGNAVDIKVRGYSPTQVSKLAKECGFTWTKVYSRWTHIDVR
jgi:hypothetical protein